MLLLGLNQPLALANIPNNRLNNSKLVDQKLKKLKTKMSALEKSITRQQQKESHTLKLLAATDKRIGLNADEIRKLEIAIAETQNTISNCDQKITQLSKQEAIEKIALTRLIENKFRQHEDPISLFLKQKSLDNYSRLQKYYQFVIKAQNNQINNYLSLLKETQKTKSTKQQETNQLFSLQQKLDSERQLLVKDHKKRKALLNTLEQEIRASTGKLNRMKKNEKQLEALLSQLEIASTWIPDSEETPKQFSAIKGKLKLPIHHQKAKLEPYQVTKTRSERHNKFYIPTKEGSLVYAVHEGRVIFSEWLRGFGLLMIIDHGEGYMSL